MNGLEESSLVRYGAVGLAARLLGLAFCYAQGYVFSGKMREECELW